MRRIRIVSRIVRYAFLAFLLVSFCNSLLSISSHVRYYGWYALFVAGSGILLCVWYWKLAQLFGFYEQGLFFASKTIRCIKFLGLLCAMGWVLWIVQNIVLRHYPLPSLQTWLQSISPPGVIVKMTGISFRWSFFSFVFAGIDFGPLLAVAVIVLIAWIMDEGRKIQEEQELTV